MATAPEKVFDTVELLEMVLHKLPTKDLLLSQRVSKHCKAVIENSVKLQHALFLHPIRIDDQTLVYLPDFLGDSSDDHEAPGTWIMPGGRDFAQNIIVVQNPLIQPLLDSIVTVNFEKTGSFMNTLPTSWSYKDSSWRKMLLIQPDMKSRVCYYERPFSGNSRIGTKVILTGNDHPGTIVDWLEAEFDTHKPKSAIVQIDAQHEFAILQESQDLRFAGMQNAVGKDDDGDMEDETETETDEDSEDSEEDEVGDESVEELDEDEA